MQQLLAHEQNNNFVKTYSGAIVILQDALLK